MTPPKTTPPRAGRLATPAADPALWPLDPAVTFLNHGSFGSCPHAVLAAQRQWRERLERQPVRFFVRDLEPLLDTARAGLARFLGADPGALAFVPNATTGVNTVLRALRFRRGDELLVTNHEYNACRNALQFVAERSGARVVEVPVPFPLESADAVIDAVLRRVTRRTRLLLIDHVTSQTGLVLPVEPLVRELDARGVDTLIDGAHAPGMVPLNLGRLGAAYYTGNCHKWLCAPKGAAFLHVRPDRQRLVRPLTISHGANSPRSDRPRFLLEFDWTGTCDPSPWLSIPAALHFIPSLLTGGWRAVMTRNHSLALAARRRLARTLGVPVPCPEDMIGAMAALPLPEAPSAAPMKSPLYLDPLQDTLLDRYRIEVPVIPWPAPPRRLLRVSAQLYNALPQYDRLARALEDLR
ncbi:MAG: aminotransferase class V-fold PLP-dependent enzyme [Verrucomicrobia bacterium]|nr:aminotransferase class V-fold PLP-dependent enzyme [Verrucomicrobiota bacterium]